MNPFLFPAINLASQSPRRAELLKQMGVPFEVILPSNPHEAEALEVVQQGEYPIEYVERVSMDKARAMSAQIRAHGTSLQQSRPTLCADTTVAYQSHILGKPSDAAHAQYMLEMLSGKTHQVHTAIVVAYQNGFIQRVITSEVTFRTLETDEILAYIASEEPFGKAGAYAVQGYSACFISHLAGSFSAVKGLPIFELAQILQQIKIHTETHL